MSADDDARYAQKLAARKARTVPVVSYPANQKAAAQAVAVDETTARYHAKLAARAAAEAKKPADDLPETTPIAPPEPEAKAESKGDIGRGGRR